MEEIEAYPFTTYTSLTSQTIMFATNVCCYGIGEVIHSSIKILEKL